MWYHAGRSLPGDGNGHALCCCLLFLFRKKHSLVSPLLEAGAFATMSLHPTVLAVQVVIATKTLERRIVLTYDAPGVDLVVDALL
jgi:hypothetical protein